jgi:hypothetical protein
MVLEAGCTYGKHFNAIPSQAADILARSLSPDCLLVLHACYAVEVVLCLQSWSGCSIAQTLPSHFAFEGVSGNDNCLSPVDVCVSLFRIAMFTQNPRVHRLWSLAQYLLRRWRLLCVDSKAQPCGHKPLHD